MFEVTYLGHQGWAFRLGEHSVVLDALVGDRFGTLGGASGYLAYPPREVQLDAFRSVDGIIISHEHEDHFDLESLQRLPRSIPLYLSSRSSAAARLAAAELGFGVQLLQVDQPVRIGGITVHPFSPDHANERTMDELDVLPLAVHDEDGHGSFFTAIDVPEDPRMLRRLRNVLRTPGIWTYTQNACNWSVQHSWVAPRRQATAKWGASILAAHLQLRAQWHPPAMSLLVGSGLAYPEPLAHLNTNVFEVDKERAAHALTELVDDHTFLAPLPGTTVRMRNGAIESVEPDERFVRVRPRGTWPDRTHRADLRQVEEYPPTCGRFELEESQVADLEQELDELGRHLFGSPLFRALYSLTQEELQGARPGLVLVLRDGTEGEVYLYEYLPQAGRFTPADSDDPLHDYAVGLECWAPDLLAMLQVNLLPASVMYGHVRAWNNLPALLDFDPGYILRGYRHPLRCPEAYLRLYRSQIAELAG